MRLTFIKGIVAPPRHIVVNKTTINVLATNTNFFSVENSKCKHKAKAMAPRKPEILKHTVNN